MKEGIFFMKKRYLRKITAFLLAVTVVIGLIPPSEVWANPQAPVRTPTPGGITNTTSPTSELHGPYSLTLAWEWTDADRITQGMASGNDPTNTQDAHTVVNFDIEWRNASAGETFNVTGSGRRVPNLPNTVRTWNSPAAFGLTSGSIYSFRVVPWHNHRVWDGSIPDYVLREMRPTPATQMQENLFLTDINVELGHGPQGGMQVTWDNPLFGNQQVFSGYRLDFRATGEGWTTGPIITPGMPGLVATNGNRTWEFEIVHGNLRLGTMYEVRVIPMVGGQLITPIDGVGGVNTVQIGGVLRNFASSHRPYTA
jgi:hypothetical protein